MAAENNLIGSQTRHGYLRPVYFATAMTLIAEAIYFVVWGLILFPGGSVMGKLLWTATCGVAMGAVVGATTMILVDETFGAFASISLAALTMAVVGSFCAFLCSRIDARFDYFGGPENSSFFVASGIIPAILGGILYGWLLYAPSRNPVEV